MHAWLVMRTFKQMYIYLWQLYQFKCIYKLNNDSKSTLNKKIKTFINQLQRFNNRFLYGMEINNLYVKQCGNGILKQKYEEYFEGNILEVIRSSY
ncbi:unnamed protein product [Paramecium sonneborni]|uniref:Uncharacterized protein n=1 Tax=Paramecium sonneborni TaxID=65129 RepID=A0A8S1QD18_9CILI|nr:unnamed protein product [Paramecium sonneborni]